MTDRIKLAHLPTPIEPLPRLKQILNGPDLWVKRDDLTGLGIGGNKTRKLEFLVGDALAHNSKTLVSAGAVQSNHCRQVAAAAARLGLDCVLVLTGNEPELIQGNLLLDRLSGAETLFVPTRDLRDSTLKETVNRLEAEGRRPYLIPYGGSNAIGAMGYVHAMHELKEQDFSCDWIVFATSSGGTQAGLILGAHETGFKGRILGISIDVPAAEFSATVADLTNAAAELKQSNFRVRAQDVLVNSDYCTAGYGVLTEADKEGFGFLHSTKAFCWIRYTQAEPQQA